MPPRPYDPEAFERAAQQLLAIPGVVGVFWGPPRRKGRWDWRQRGIAVRVERKLADPPVPVPAEIEGFRTDVIEVGEPVAAAVGPGDPAGRHADPERAGVITTVAVAGPVLWALVSGHACLPLDAAGRIVAALEGAPAPAFALPAGAVAGGAVVAGRLDGAQDWAILRLEGQSPQPLHPGAQPPAPAPHVRSLVGEGSVVRHWSTRQRGPREGRVTGTWGHTVVTLPPPDGRRLACAQVAEVRAPHGPFALNGDSGSLVFLRDGPPRAVGVVLAVTQGTLGGRPYHSAWIRSAHSLPLAAPDLTPFFA